MKAMDTLATVKRLRAAGLNEEQAEALTSVIAESIEAGAATKADLKEATVALERKIETGLSTLEHKIEAVRLDFRAELQKEMRQQTITLTVLIGGIVSLLVALDRLLPALGSAIQ
ncbi:hypothetical protein [Azospirillum sp. SYSU D00513]|uniref:hypothetical protein n=1 Tax=Azospirillum sp. SYSU D00513 TaxID=2812561 RepID=UPI001A976847|nr:hypothetical protein [Azospirillum sp. SYSU D00513]